MNTLRISAVIAILLITGCAGPKYFYAGAGIGKNGAAMSSYDYWDDGGGVGAKLYGGFRHNISGAWWGDARASHHSQWDVGPPFDDAKETESDHVFYSVEYHFGVSP